MAERGPLDYAIQLERDGQAFYTQAAATTRNPLGKRMFESLAADERRHEQALVKLAQEADVALEGDLPRKRLVTLFATLGAELRAQLGADAGDRAVIDQAIEIEKASVDHYGTQAGQASGEPARALYQRLVEEETQHVEILEGTRAYLDDTGHWFLWDEQSILDGG
jgi:rubrerythrin